MGEDGSRAATRTHSKGRAPRARGRDALKARVWDMWLDCLDDRAIEEIVGKPKSTVSGWLTEFRRFAHFGKPAQ
jgi:hypothetical protein